MDSTNSETQAFGLAAPLGVVSATGVAGLTLHGGMGWLLRKHGLSIDKLMAVDVVTADGQLHRADLDHNADLFRAIRGGGNFGVVTAFEFKLHPVGPQVWFSVPIYPAERAGEVMGRFREYMETAPDDLMGLGGFWSAPEIPEIPERHHGKPVVFLLTCSTQKTYSPAPSISRRDRHPRLHHLPAGLPRGQSVHRLIPREGHNCWAALRLQ